MKYKYEVVRSARKSIAVIISAENKITVRCGWGVREDEIERFLNSKIGWIEKNVLKNSLKLARNDDVIEYKRIYVKGEMLPLVFSDKNEVTADTVYIKRVEFIEKLFIESFFAEFKARVEELAKTTILYPASIAVKNYTGRWGCCDAKNNLIFNYKLFMLPQDLQDYVIVHELCHTLCHNHSEAFWKLVSEFIPDYKVRRKQLCNYDFITSLY